MGFYLFKRFNRTIYLLLIGTISSSLIPSHALAADPNAIAAIRFFSDACIPRIGKPDEIRAWAAARKLPEITSPQLRDAFVGPGGKGAAWIVPSIASRPHFALSIRGTTEACAVWIERADPADVTAAFIRIAEGIARPGVKIVREKDIVSTSQFGEGRAIMYQVTGDNHPAGYELTLLTSEKPGGLFQVSMQASLVQSH